MNDAHPIMAMLLGSNSFVGPSERVENEIEPLPAQFNFGIGDAAILAQANTPLENDFVIAKCVDPSEYAATFPDWEERLMNSFVLCEFFSKSDPNLSLGWVSRLKLMPVTNYRYRQLRKWMKDGFPPELPEWVVKNHEKYTSQLAEQAPHVVPRMVSCPNCKKDNVALEVVRKLTYTAKAGRLLRDEEDVLVPISEVDEQSTHQARLRCLDCHSLADLEDPEWALPGISQ